MHSPEQNRKKAEAQAEAKHHHQNSAVDGERSIGQSFFPDTASNREFFARERENARRSEREKMQSIENEKLVDKIPKRKD